MIQGRDTAGCILRVAGLEERLAFVNLDGDGLAETLDPVVDDHQSSHHPQENQSPSSYLPDYQQKSMMIRNRHHCRRLFHHTVTLESFPHSRAQAVQRYAQAARSHAAQKHFVPNRATPCPSLIDFLPLLLPHVSMAVCRCSRRREVDQVVWRDVVFGERLVREIGSVRVIPCRFPESVGTSRA